MEYELADPKAMFCWLACLPTIARLALGGKRDDITCAGRSVSAAQRVRCLASSLECAKVCAWVGGKRDDITLQKQQLQQSGREQENYAVAVHPFTRIAAAVGFHMVWIAVGCIAYSLEAHRVGFQLQAFWRNRMSREKQDPGKSQGLAQTNFKQQACWGGT